MRRQVELSAKFAAVNEAARPQAMRSVTRPVMRLMACVAAMFGALATIGIAGLATTAARAADLPAAPGYYPPVAAYAPALYNWTGFYAGFNIGAGLLSDQFTQTSNTVLQHAGNQYNIITWGPVGGGQVGFNYQFSSIVLGAEFEAVASGMTGSLNSGTLESASMRSTSAPSWLLDATARIGFAVDTFLVYAKGGVAWEKARYTESVLSATGVTISSANLTAGRTGYVFGAGMEYGLTEQWTAKFEWNYYGFGTANYTFNLVDAAHTPGVPVALPTSIQARVLTYEVGLNYRFNWAPATAVAPVVSARY